MFLRQVFLISCIVRFCGILVVTKCVVSYEADGMCEDTCETIDPSMHSFVHLQGTESAERIFTGMHVKVRRETVILKLQEERNGFDVVTQIIAVGIHAAKGTHVQAIHILWDIHVSRGRFARIHSIHIVQKPIERRYSVAKRSVDTSNSGRGWRSCITFQRKICIDGFFSLLLEVD